MRSGQELPIVGILAEAGAAGSFRDLLEAAPDELEKALFLIGDLEPAVRRRLERVLSAHADDLSLIGLCDSETSDLRRILADGACCSAAEEVVPGVTNKEAELQTPSEHKPEPDDVFRSRADLQDFLQNLLSAADVDILVLDSALRIEWFSSRAAALLGLTATDEGRPIDAVLPEPWRGGFLDDARAALAGGSPAEREIARPDGWEKVRLRPHRSAGGTIRGVVATFSDATERRRIGEALHANEQRLRQQTRLVELSRAPIFVWDFDGGILEWNRGSEDLYGFEQSEALGQQPQRLLKTRVPACSYDALKQALLQDGIWKGELEHCAKDGRELVVESTLELVTMDGRRLVLESTSDITDRKRWDERQRLLLRELTHRVKNALAVVQSLARQTLRTTQSSDDFARRFEGRLLALADAHKLLQESRWQGAELATLVKNQVAVHLVDDPSRLKVNGEKVVLSPDLATPFGLVLHELATNAAKYGALSVHGGSVELDWSLADRNDRRLLSVIWRERGGPPVTRPDVAGFGSVLIGKGIPGASVRHEFRPDGVICKIELPLSEAGSDGISDE